MTFGMKHQTGLGAMGKLYTIRLHSAETGKIKA